jgi:hypothetical protein
MGTRTDEAERAVSAQRERISGMLDDLEQRTRKDLRSVEHGISTQAEGIKHQAAEKLDAVERRVPQVDMVSRQLRKHPLSSVALGFGAGVALGVASESRGGTSSRGRAQQQTEAADRRSRSRRDEDGREDDQGLLGGILGAVTGRALATVMPAVQDELQSLFKQAAAAFFETDRGGDGPRQSTVDREDRSEKRVRARERFGADGHSAHDRGLVTERQHTE